MEEERDVKDGEREEEHERWREGGREGERQRDREAGNKVRSKTFFTFLYYNILIPV